MAKELPYFKYFPSEWVTGDVTLCSFEAQGVFISICSFYWMKNCSMSLANAKQRFSNNETALKELLNNSIIKVDEDENIIIDFLDEQMNEFVSVSEKRAVAGSRGGKAKAKQLLKVAKAKPSNKDKEVDKEKEVNNIYSLYPSKCPNRKTSTNKSSKDKDKIKKHLKEIGFYDLKERIEFYLNDCKKSGTYLKNFGTFLNNLPDKQEKQEEILKLA